VRSGANQVAASLRGPQVMVRDGSPSSSVDTTPQTAVLCRLQREADVKRAAGHGAGRAKPYAAWAHRADVVERLWLTWWTRDLVTQRRTR
jgi:hypothetical protein